MTTNTTSLPTDYTISIPPGQSASVPPGSVISVGTNTQIVVDAGSVLVSPNDIAGGFLVHAANASSITLQPGTAFLAGPGWSEGGVAVSPGLITVGPTPVTLNSTPLFPILGSSGTLNARSSFSARKPGITTVGNTATGLAGFAGATITNVSGTVTYTATSPIPGLVTAASSPGLAGTAGIQPQFNADGLADWARRLIPAGEAAAALG